ncbi:MAG: ATP-binding protein [Candidatus Eremiobacteraeota bacterium]|nr:ATP-binding protein [Candidatus Eremiobacteraeota bacterium]
MPANYVATYTSDPKNVATARNAVASFAHLCGFPDDVVCDIRLAAGEALSNAAEHGRGARGGGFTVRCWFEDETVFIEVQDSGGGFSEAPSASGPDHRGRGFGISIMRRLMNSISFSHNGTRIRLTKRLPQSESSGHDQIGEIG